MELLFKREQTSSTVSSRVTFKLWGKLEVSEDEQALIGRYCLDEAVLIVQDDTRRFGFLHSSQNVPVVLTEWMGGSGRDSGPGLQDLPTWRVMRDMANYLNEYNIALVSNEFDVDTILIKDVHPQYPGMTNTPNDWIPTNYDLYSTYTAETRPIGLNVGTLVCRFFRYGYGFAGPYTQPHGESAYVVGNDGPDSPCTTDRP